MMRDKLMTRSGEERFLVGAQAFESAREMVKASLPLGYRRRSDDDNCSKRLYGGLQ